jgi:cold shock CspA family protein/ribosome-associated translation inhibitor RaiA
VVAASAPTLVLLVAGWDRSRAALEPAAAFSGRVEIGAVFLRDRARHAAGTVRTMQTPLHLVFQDIAPSDAVEAAIRDKVAKLEHLFGRITSCRVVVSCPRARGHQGHLYGIHVEIVVPGGKDIIVSREPGRDHAHEDIYVAIRDAFDAAGRRLQDHARRRRGVTKHHEQPPHGWITQVFHAKGYGFIRAASGEDVYFHRNALAADFDTLEIGAEVRFAVAETESPHGPQATSVVLVGKQHVGA